MNIQRDITKNTHLLGKSVQEKYSTSRSHKQYFMTTQLCLKERKKMRISKILASVIGVGLIPFTGIVFMQKADAYQVPVAGYPVGTQPGKCTTFINVSSSGRDTWYWEVGCGRNASRKEYLKAKKACVNDYENREETHSHFYRGTAEDAFRIVPYAHNKCY